MIIMDDGRIARGGAIKVEEETAARIEIELLEPNARLHAFLDGYEGVEVKEIQERSALVELEDDAQARHALLKGLMGAGFAVSAFSLRKRRLEDTYFDEMES